MSTSSASAIHHYHAEDNKDRKCGENASRCRYLQRAPIFVIKHQAEGHRTNCHANYFATQQEPCALCGVRKNTFGIRKSHGGTISVCSVVCGLKGSTSSGTVLKERHLLPVPICKWYVAFLLPILP